MPCRSLFRKAFPRKPVASEDAHTAMVIAQLMGPHAASVASQITGPSNVEALGGETVQPVAHHPREGHRIDRVLQWQQAQQRQGTRKRRKQQAETHSQKARQWPWQRRRKTLQDKRTDSYWSFRITTPSQS